MEAEEEFSEASSIKQSKFNSTISQLMRIDSLWKDAHSHSRNGKLISWNWDLDRIFCELSEDATKPQIDKFFEFNKRISDLKRSPSLLYNLLLKKEIFLREMQNKQGKGTAYQESMDEYMSD